jgi:hypothetical protein
MIDLLDLGDIGYVVFQNTELTNFRRISGNANSTLKRERLS